MKFIVGTMQMLVVLSLLQTSGVSAVGLRHLRHVPHHDQESRLPVVGVSLMQGKVEIGKTNTTVKAAAGSLKNHPWHTWARAATTANVLAVKLDKNKMHFLKVGAAAFFVVIALCVAIGVIALFYDVTARFLHRSRFLNCLAKVQRAHAAFSSKSGELPLCPYCVEHLSCKRGPNKVVFMCGHRWHVECSNRWFSEHPTDSTHCPICRDVEPTLEICKGKTEDKMGCGCKAEVPVAEPSSEDFAVDGAFSFILQSLNRLYPEIITKDHVERWLACNTDIWLSELVCPRYNSILKFPRKGSK